MQAASDDTTDNRIIWTCCKNNDGDLGKRSAWERCNGLFKPVAEFDWDTFDAPADGRETINETDVAAVFNGGALTRADAVKTLMETTGASRPSCYRVLKLDGRFSKHLHSTEDRNLKWIP